MLGKIQPRFFPGVFGPNADQPLDADVVQARFAALAAGIAEATGEARTPEDVAEGFLKIAVENMANAIKQISVQRGYDVTEYTLNCFGGAGGQHACLVADALGMTKVLLHPYAGVLSAYGMGLADIRAMREQSVELTLEPAVLDDLAGRLGALGTAARVEIEGQGVETGNITVLAKAHLRYQGTDTALIVPFAGPDAMTAAFEDMHTQRFGFTMPGRALVVEAISAEAIGVTEKTIDPERPRGDGAPPLAAADRVQTRFMIAGARHPTPVYDREAISPGDAIDGPAIVVDANATTVVEPGWRAEVTVRDHLILRRVVARPARVAIGTRVDPVMLEVFNNLFMSIAEQMGVTLQNTAYSVNIKERLDFSCAVFDADGGLVANAPHMPVHLGSMGESIETVIRERQGTMKPGDVFVLNAPYNGGTHLPDITVITPVFDAAGNEILFFVGSRGHHADIGGITPGSMPPLSTTVEEEGALLDSLVMVRGGVFQEDAIRAALTSGPYPARNPDRTWPTCAPRSPPTKRRVRSCARWSSTSASTWSPPTWATCRTTPRSRCAASSTC